MSIHRPFLFVNQIFKKVDNSPLDTEYALVVKCRQLLGGVFCRLRVVYAVKI